MITIKIAIVLTILAYTTMPIIFCFIISVCCDFTCSLFKVRWILVSQYFYHLSTAKKHNVSSSNNIVPLSRNHYSFCVDLPILIK